MFRARGILLLVASVAWLAPGARAADNESAKRCSEIETDTQRLACYDQLFGAPARTRQVESSVIAAATVSPVATLGEHDVRGFGLSEADQRRSANLPAAPDSISLTIESVSRRPTGEQIFRTKEGQVWVEVEPSSQLRVQPGETVTIRKATLGSYMLVTSRRAGAKVRRLN